MIRLLQRRQALHLGLAAAVSGVAMGATAGTAIAAVEPQGLIPTGAVALRELMEKLASAPRHRDFKTVPMILASSDQWDHEALSAILAYKPAHKQVWDNTDLSGPWLNLMRNALNAQVWAFKHADFLVVSATHGTAHLSLFDDAMWEKYKLTTLAGDEFRTNTLIEGRSAGFANPANYEDPAGAFSLEDNSIPALMRRGVVFMALPRCDLGASRGP